MSEVYQANHLSFGISFEESSSTVRQDASSAQRENIQNTKLVLLIYNI